MGHRELPRYKPAIKFAKTAFERFGELGCQLGQGMVKDAMGRVYIVMDKPDKARLEGKHQSLTAFLLLFLKPNNQLVFCKNEMPDQVK